MRKREFLRELRTRLERIDCREIEDVLEYYDELIEDTIDRTGKSEEEVVRDLGPIRDIILRVNPSKEVRGTRDDKIYYDEYKSDDSTRRYEPRHDIERRAKPKKKNYFVRALIAIITFPIWFTILAVLVALIIAAVAAGIGIGLAGISYIVYGIVHFRASTGNAIFQCGVGVVAIAIALILAPLLIKIVGFLVKLVIRFVKSLVGISKKRSYSYEN